MKRGKIRRNEGKRKDYGGGEKQNIRRTTRKGRGEKGREGEIRRCRSFRRKGKERKQGRMKGKGKMLKGVEK